MCYWCEIISKKREKREIKREKKMKEETVEELKGK